MYLGTSSGLSMITVIELLEIFLLVDSIGLVVSSKGKVVKIVNAVLAIIWVICIVMNIVSYGFFK
jgi:hypothetical protein